MNKMLIVVVVFFVFLLVGCVFGFDEVIIVKMNEISI